MSTTTSTEGTGLSWPSLDQALSEEALRANAEHDWGMKAMANPNGVAREQFSAAQRHQHLELTHERALELLSALATIIGDPALQTLRTVVTELATAGIDTAQELATERDAATRSADAGMRTALRLHHAQRTAVALEQDYADARAFALHHAGLDIDADARRFPDTGAEGGHYGPTWAQVRDSQAEINRRATLRPVQQVKQIVAEELCTDVLTDVLPSDNTSPLPQRYFVCTVKGPHTEHGDGSGMTWTRTRTIASDGSDSQASTTSTTSSDQS